MKKVTLSILSFLVISMALTSFAYSADTGVVSSESAAVVAVAPAPQQVDVETSFVNVISDLMDSDIGYQLNDSTSISLAYSPFSEERSDVQDHQLDSDVYIGLKFSF